jgi:hypothetical protein
MIYRLIKNGEQALLINSPQDYVTDHLLRNQIWKAVVGLLLKRKKMAPSRKSIAEGFKLRMFVAL